MSVSAIRQSGAVRRKNREMARTIMHLITSPSCEPLEDIMIAERYCPICEGKDKLICFRGRVFLDRPRAHNKPARFLLITHQWFQSYWRIDSTYYETPDFEVLTEEQLVKEIAKNSQGYANVVATGPCTKFPELYRFSFYFWNRTGWPLGEETHYQIQLADLPINMDNQPKLNVPTPKSPHRILGMPSPGQL